MDRLAFPQDWKILVLLRAECAFTLLLLYTLLGSRWGEKYHLLIGHLIEGALILSILAMIGNTGGGESPYYAGLCLIMVGASLLLRWSVWHGVLNVVLCCGGYSLLLVLYPTDARVWNESQDGPNLLAISTFFLYVTGFFSVAGTYFLYELRLNEFRLREELTAERKRLESSHRKLKELDKSKTNFFANISHELRTPLTLILGPLETLSSCQPVKDNAKLKTLVHSMEDNGLRLLRLINELLDLIRLDGAQQTVKKELVNVQKMLSSIQRSLLPTAEQKGLSIDLKVHEDLDAIYKFDRVKVEKVLLNLTTNAVKFTPSRGTLSIKARPLVDGMVEFVVADTGCGMKEDELENAFRRFWQADSGAQRKHGGVGIGLSLVNGIVEVLEGSIEVESELEQGTTFTVKLPLGQRVEGNEATKPLELDPIEQLNRRAQLSGSGILEDFMNVEAMDSLSVPQTGIENPLILVAEDEPEVRRLIVSHLKNYSLMVASDGDQALQLAHERTPDLILLDWMMPARNGLDVCRALRSSVLFARTPIIMLTARIDESSKIEALEAGANDFLTKPFASTELKLRIRHLLDTGRYEKEVVQKSEQLEVALEDLKESESMLVQAEKLSSLGQMSAGIIHEINNPLNYAKTNLYALKTFAKLLPSEEKDDFVEITSDVEEGLERVVQIVKDLRSFAVKDKTQFSDVNLAEVIAASARLLGNRLTCINYEAEVPDHVHITGNSNQLCQVFVNFIQNSLDALQEVERENDEGHISVSLSESADWVSLHFKDNGCGISKENQQNIFDPFYSSKDIGKGMGLGLSICYRILEQHGVKTEIESEVGLGTHFTLKFPVILNDHDFNEVLQSTLETSSTTKAQ